MEGIPHIYTPFGVLWGVVIMNGIFNFGKFQEFEPFSHGDFNTATMILKTEFYSILNTF
jgi:hypothetical protein